MTLDNPSEQPDEGRPEPAESETGRPVPIPPALKVPELFSDLRFIEELQGKKLSQDTLITMVYAADNEKRIQCQRADRLQTEVDQERAQRHVAERDRDVLSERLAPLTLSNALFVAIGGVALACWTFPETPVYRRIFLGVGVGCSVGAVLLNGVAIVRSGIGWIMKKFGT